MNIIKILVTSIRPTTINGEPRLVVNFLKQDKTKSSTLLFPEQAGDWEVGKPLSVLETKSDRRDNNGRYYMNYEIVDPSLNAEVLEAFFSN